MRPLIILTFLASIFSCEKQRGQVEKFIFDNKQISTKDIHRYEFDNEGRIRTSYSTTFTYISGVPFDSITYIKHFQYNRKGQVVKIFDSTDSTLQTTFYNEFDSLVADYTINRYGDTIRLTIIDFLKEKSHKRLERILSMKIPEDFGNVKEEDLRTYDTLSFMREVIYDGDQHVRSLSFKDEVLTEEILPVYEDGRNTKTITYGLLGDNKYIKETTYFSESSVGDLESVTIGPQNDTIAFTKTILQDGSKITINYMGKFNMQDIFYYDKSGQNIGTVLLDLKEKVKTVYSHKYDDNGNLIQSANYRERIK